MTGQAESCRGGKMQLGFGNILKINPTRLVDNLMQILGERQELRMFPRFMTKTTLGNKLWMRLP